MAKIRAVLFDIEGTTTSISFVQDVLFPYARNSLSSFLLSSWDLPQTQDDISLLRSNTAEDIASGLEIPAIAAADDSQDSIIQSIVKNVHWQMDRDRKATALKQLQGHMWEIGYKGGELKGPVYEDVVPAFENIKEKGTPIYIYSSGSIHAQKLLFGNSSKGDLLPFFSGHFDTTIGLKIVSQSYLDISARLSLPPENILFVTDSIKETEAATAVGVNVLVAVREGNAALPEEHPFKTITSFDQIFLQDFVFSA
mmetsp:Transcript_2711/g.4838  ORF Transcript_2711/g.4838 Transcript_2711/m.4838 type:complete len:254 (+) Transcript_2711:83-844(+)